MELFGKKHKVFLDPPPLLGVAEERLQLCLSTSHVYERLCTRKNTGPLYVQNTPYALMPVAANIPSSQFPFSSCSHPLKVVLVVGSKVTGDRRAAAIYRYTRVLMGFVCT